MMNKIAVVTDSNSGITQAQGEALGIYVIPMPFTINGDNYFEDINLTQEEFYKLQGEDADISTSQPIIGDMLDLWDKLLKEYDEIIQIPMSSGLSGSCATATTLAEDYDGRVQIVNNQRISVTQRESVLEAIELAKMGKSAKEIKNILEEHKLEASIYITVDTLQYLKKGGRVTPAAAAIGTVLNLKPVLQIQGEKLDAFAKVRGMKQAKKVMLEALQKDIDTRFAEGKADKSLHLYVAHTQNEEAALAMVEELKTLYPGFSVHMDPLSLSVACHTGPGSIGVGCANKLAELK